MLVIPMFIVITYWMRFIHLWERASSHFPVYFNSIGIPSNALLKFVSKELFKNWCYILLYYGKHSFVTWKVLRGKSIGFFFL